MKKNAIPMLGILLAALAALLFLLLPVTGNLIIAYVFWLIGIAFMIYSVYALSSRDESLLMEFPLFIVARSYLLVTALLSAIVLLLITLDVFAVPTVLHLIVQVAVLLLFGIRVVQLNLGKAHIQQVEAEAAGARNALTTLVTKINALKSIAADLPADVRQGLGKTINAVSDALRYADPISTKAAAELDEKIKSGVAQLGRAVSAGQADEALLWGETLLADIKQRNERNKNSKR